MLGVGNILVGISTFFTGTIAGFWSLMVWGYAAGFLRRFGSDNEALSGGRWRSHIL